MLVKDLVKLCYDTIIIYTDCDEGFLEFKDLYKGDRKNIPSDLLELSVKCFGAKRETVTEISV